MGFMFLTSHPYLHLGFLVVGERQCEPHQHLETNRRNKMVLQDYIRSFEHKTAFLGNVHRNKARDLSLASEGTATTSALLLFLNSIFGKLQLFDSLAFARCILANLRPDLVSLPVRIILFGSL